VPEIDPELLRSEVRSRADAWWKNATNNQRGRLDLRAATREIVKLVFEEMGYDVSLAAEVANRYRDLREERVCVFPGAIETLEWLRSQGVRLGMMTNGSSSGQRAKIERFELAAHFEHILIEGEFGVGKPHPRVYATLLDALRAPPEGTWAVGDNLEFDVFGAMDAGINGIWVDARGRGLPEGTTRQPDRIIASICELRTGNG
jgi:putative hydrolase of the HAD superfamily